MEQASGVELCVDDMLISVDGKKASKLGYEKVVKMLCKERLPIILHFRAPQGSNRGASSADAIVRDSIDGTFATELQPCRRCRDTPSLCCSCSGASSTTS
ncbi:hypothetical protein Gpo141_00006766 [Globisporangium polare]